MSHWTEKQQNRFLEILEAQDRGECKIAYWNSDAHGFPANHDCKDLKWRAEPGKIQEIEGPLELCSFRALHATLEPHRWLGSRVWIVALWGEIKEHTDKLGALKREIVGEILSHETFNTSVGARLGRKDLAGANLTRASLSKVNLCSANLSKANLYEADFSNSDLSMINLYHSNLSGANLIRADLYRADLTGAELFEANLSGADLFGANLSRANLIRTNLTRANLSEADLTRTNLSGANLSGADLFGTNLSGANLVGANLYKTNLSDANLSSEANLSGAYVGFNTNIDGWKNVNGCLAKC